MKVKQVRPDSNMTLFCIVVILTPISYIINLHLFVILMYIGGILLAQRTEKTGNRFLLLMLYTTLFSGVSIAGFRPYDIIVLLQIISLIFTEKEIKMPIRIVPFLLVVLAGLLINYNSESLMEALRYIMCIIVIIKVRNDQFELDALNQEIIAIIICNIFYAIVVFGFIYSGRFMNYSSSIVNTNIYIYGKELRLNGFFSDPNKYMAFCFALLFIVGAFLKKSVKRTIMILMLILSSLIALSRTSLIVIFTFIVLRMANKIKKKSKSLFFALILSAIFIIIFVSLVPDEVNNFFNRIYVLSSRFMGRNRQLELSSSLQGDNRTRIWRMSLGLIKQRPIIGYGWLSNEWLLPYPTHNSIFALLLDGGLVALIAYCIMLWPMFSNKRWDLVISCIIVPSLMLDLQNYRIWFLIFGLLICPNLSVNNELE